jgi:SAM-dependent methyltransferase
VILGTAVLLPWIASGCAGGSGADAASPAFANDAAAASTRTTQYVPGPATPDGIGKYYMGREISQVMGHLGAGWLERESREAEERTDLLMEFLLEQGGATVADIGAGTGYFSLPWAGQLPDGEVLAVDIQPEMLEIIRWRTEELGIDNVRPILGAIDDPALPEDAVDVVLLVDAYHEFSHPREMMTGIFRGLRAGGRLVLVEYRAEDPSIPIKTLHKMSEAQAIREVTSVGLEWVTTEDFLPTQHVMVFRKP